MSASPVGRLPLAGSYLDPLASEQPMLWTAIVGAAPYFPQGRAPYTKEELRIWKRAAREAGNTKAEYALNTLSTRAAQVYSQI